MLRLDLRTVQKLCHRSFLLRFEKPRPECAPSERSPPFELRPASSRIPSASSDPKVLAVPRGPPLHPSTTVCERLWFDMSSSGAIKDVRLRRASLLRRGCAAICTCDASGASIHTGIFRRFPSGSLIETAPSPRFDLRITWRLKPWSG